jgi:hypothetical protein
MEFKKNRMAAMLEGMQALQPTQALTRPAFFSNAKEVQAIQSGQQKAKARLTKLRARYVKAIQKPAVHDPVYKMCQRIFHKDDALCLTRDTKMRSLIRRRALRRFLMGYPPRKKNDTSMGDAINWEWMIECANTQNAELVLVSRDSDYGLVYESRAYPNDHLLQEFHERVSRKRELLLYTKVSEALDHFKIHVTPAEKKEEEEIARPAQILDLGDLSNLKPSPKWIQESIRALKTTPSLSGRLDEMLADALAAIASYSENEKK